VADEAIDDSDGHRLVIEHYRVPLFRIDW
jgi:hypothetical protein